MLENWKPSDRATLVAQVAPVSQGVGSVSTGWVDAGLFGLFMAEVGAGVLGAAATLDAKIEQATSSGGAGAKDVTGATITQMVKATDDGKVAFINLNPARLDVDNAFKWIRVTLTVAAAASLVTCRLYGFGARYAPGSHLAALKAVTDVV